MCHYCHSSLANNINCLINNNYLDTLHICFCIIFDNFEFPLIVSINIDYLQHHNNNLINNTFGLLYNIHHYIEYNEY